MGDTLEIFGKEYTNVAGFKAKDSSGNTLTYTRGGGGSGVDIPIFTLTWDSNFETILSVTCNKTYAQCKSMYESSETPTVVAIASTYSGDELYQESLALNGVMGGTTIRGDFLDYTCSYSGTPQYDIWFFEDGTITAIQPSNRAHTLNVTTNGTYTPEYGDYVWNEVVVNVPSGSSNLQVKTNITPSTSSQTITADSGYDGLSSVQINAMPSGTAGTPTATKGTVSNHAITVTPSVTNTTGYITGGTKTGTAVIVSASELVSGSETKTANSTYDVTNLAELVVNVPTGTARSSSDLTVSGATVTVPAGLYSSQATKSVASGSATTPTTTITANPTISINSSGLITASVSGSQSVTPSVSAGYVSSGTAGTVSVSGSKTSQLTTKAAATYYPSTTEQTISASQYLTGTQTIKAVTVSGLSAANIASGVTVNIGDSADADRIMSVTGTLAFQTIYSGSSTPSSSMGSNGDIYIKTS